MPETTRLECAFCKKDETKVRIALVLNVAICEECVDTAREVTPELALPLIFRSKSN